MASTLTAHPVCKVPAPAAGDVAGPIDYTLESLERFARNETCAAEGCDIAAMSSSGYCRNHHYELLVGPANAATPDHPVCVVADCTNRPAEGKAGYCRNHHVRVLSKGATCSIDGCDTEARTAGYCPTHHRQWRNGFATCNAPNCVNSAISGGLCATHRDKGVDYVIGADRGYDPCEPAFVYFIRNDAGLGKIGISQTIDKRLNAHVRQGLNRVIAVFQLDTWIQARRVERDSLAALHRAGASPAVSPQDMPYGGYTETFKMSDVPVTFDLETYVEAAKAGCGCAS